MADFRPSRRRFLAHAALAATALPLLARSEPASAQSDALEKLPPDNPQARALHYTEDAATVNEAAYKPGSTCANCALFIAANGGCEAFMGYRVAAKGWCASWSKAS